LIFDFLFEEADARHQPNQPSKINHQTSPSSTACPTATRYFTMSRANCKISLVRPVRFSQIGGERPSIDRHYFFGCARFHAAIIPAKRRGWGEPKEAF
jgi:hypothetical protein